MDGLACNLGAQAVLVPEPGNGWWARVACGSSKGRVVATSRWFELHGEGEARRACGWHSMDAGGRGGNCSVSRPGAARVCWHMQGSFHSVSL